VPNDRSTALSIHRFGGFTLDNHRDVLRSPDGQEIALRPKALQLLCLLVENAGEVIDRDRIMRSVRPEVTISDDGITQCVRDIRRALGDEAQRIVRTLPKRGYVLGPVLRERIGARSITEMDRDAVANRDRQLAALHATMA
jgi:adenylate cyclase